MLHAPDHMLCFKIGFNTAELECNLSSRGELYVPGTFSIFLCLKDKSFTDHSSSRSLFLINCDYLLK